MTPLHAFLETLLLIEGAINLMKTNGNAEVRNALFLHLRWQTAFKCKTLFPPRNFPNFFSLRSPYRLNRRKNKGLTIGKGQKILLMVLLIFTRTFQRSTGRTCLGVEKKNKNKNKGSD